MSGNNVAAPIEMAAKLQAACRNQAADTRYVVVSTRSTTTYCIATLSTDIAKLKRYLMTNCINFYNLKELTLKDFDAIKKLFKEVFMAPPWNDDWSDENQLNEYLLDLMEVRTSLVYGLYVKEVLTGVSIGNIRHWWGGTEYHIEELFIRTSEQGKGLGTKFVDMIEAAIPAKGAKQIFLQTETTVPAYEFYKKRGFDELKTHVSFFKELEK